MPLPPCAHPRAASGCAREGGRARAAGAEVKAKLKAGSLGLEELFDQGTRDERAREAQGRRACWSRSPGVGKVQARRIMEELDISGAAGCVGSAQPAGRLLHTPRS